MIKRKAELKGLNKAAIVQEYLLGEETFKDLEEKYGVPSRTIQSWVRAYRKTQGDEFRKTSTQKEKELQEELEQLKLKNELLEEIINLSEKQTGLSLRKKFGPKQ
jgi:transposase-like protein